MGHLFKKAAVTALAAVIAAGTLAGCGSKDKKIDGSKTLLTVNGEEVSLGTAAFLAKYNQAQTYQIYSSYFGMTDNIFDTVMDSESGESYGDIMKRNALEELERLVVIGQHAGDFGVSLSDEQKAEIAAAAAEVVAENSAEVMDKIGAREEDIAKLMELQTINSMMMDPMVEDVDANVTDEEAQQSSITYVRVNVPEAAESGVESIASAVEPVADPVLANVSSGAESVAEAVELNDLQSAAYAKAQAVIDAIKAEANIADADLDAIAKTVDSSLMSFSGQYTTENPADSALDIELARAAGALKDGEILDHPVMNTDGSAFYAVRMDHVFDEELTESTRGSILNTRKQTLFDEKVDGWLEESDIKVEEKLWKLITISDKAPFSLAPHDHAEEAESSVESAVESVAETTAVEDVAAPESGAEAPAA